MLVRRWTALSGYVLPARDMVDFGSILLGSYYYAHDAGRIQPRYDFVTQTFVYCLSGSIP
jgi:hypothetical protein